MTKERKHDTITAISTPPDTVCVIRYRSCYCVKGAIRFKQGFMEAIMNLRDDFNKHYNTLKGLLPEVPATQVTMITDLMYTMYLFGREDTALFSAEKFDNRYKEGV